MENAHKLKGNGKFCGFVSMKIYWIGFRSMRFLLSFIANSENRFKSNSSKLGVNFNAIFLLRSILRFDSNAYLMTHDNIFRQPKHSSFNNNGLCVPFVCRMSHISIAVLHSIYVPFQNWNINFAKMWLYGI